MAGWAGCRRPGEPVEQGQVHGLGCGLGEGFELGFGLLAFVVECGEPGAEGGGGGVTGVVGDLLEFEDLGVLGGVDFLDAGLEGGLGGLALGGGVGGGELGFEEGGAFGSEDAGGEEGAGDLV